MANTVSVDALRREMWKKELFQDVIDGMYFTQNGLMGEGDNNIVQTFSDLKKESEHYRDWETDRKSHV